MLGMAGLTAQQIAAQQMAQQAAAQAATQAASQAATQTAAQTATQTAQQSVVQQTSQQAGQNALQNTAQQEAQQSALQNSSQGLQGIENPTPGGPQQVNLDIPGHDVSGAQVTPKGNGFDGQATIDGKEYKVYSREQFNPNTEKMIAQNGTKVGDPITLKGADGQVLRNADGAPIQLHQYQVGDTTYLSQAEIVTKSQAMTDSIKQAVIVAMVSQAAGGLTSG